MIKKLLLLFLCFDALVLSAIFIQESIQSASPARENPLLGIPTTIKLSHRLFTVFEFPAAKTPPSALILFGSGDGGWSRYEARMCRALRKKGYTVIGIDSNDYAKTDYDLATLQADYSTIVQEGLSAYPSSTVPVIIAGWSMGAAQAVAAAGGPNPPPGVKGLLLIAPSSRGRYGLRIADRVDILPIGPGTFALSDFSDRLNNLRIAQWHAANDTEDSTAWLADLKATHREFDFPNAGHFYRNTCPQFLDQLVKSADWVVNPPAPAQ